MNGSSPVEYSKIAVAELRKKAPIRVLHMDDEESFLNAAKPCLEMRENFK